MPFNRSNRFFALDIGTRSVMGIIIQKNDKQYQIIDYAIEEHEERSMLDGQIHDVVAVAKVIQKVKETLEEKHGPLQKVAVAAAGRALKTKRATIVHELAGRPLMTDEDVITLELAAVQLAQAELAKEHEQEEMTSFYCVGYSVIRYCLDESEIGSLVEQRGQQASIEIIATFLPHMVVDSLISALNRADLEMAALTLEPIASINVLIPQTMRKLNVALVDIGAGTSDIAITADGTVTAYGMVPYAGDEITEALTQQYLLDFPVAESIKRKLTREEQIEFEDILQFKHTLSSVEIVKSIQPAIQQLAERICQEILRLNGKAPQAVMLIGGGAQTATLNHWVAELLGLPQNRVGIRGLSNNQQVTIEPVQQGDPDAMVLEGPEFVTPIGIAIAAEKHPIKYITVKVNQQPIRLFDLRKLTIADALLASGINIKKLHGKPGLALSIEVNGKLTHFPGTHGEPPSILANGEKVSLHTPLTEDLNIEVIAGKDGETAQVYARDLLDDVQEGSVVINDTKYKIPTNILVNGSKVDPDTILKERDRVEIDTPRHLEALLEALGLPYAKFLKPKEARVIFNDQPITLQERSSRIIINGKSANLDAVIHDGDQITLNMGESTEFLFHDVFRYVDVDLSQPIRGKQLVLKVNGEPATFDTIVKEGDYLELKFE